MAVAYQLMYRLGVTPWEHEDIAEPLVALVEGEQALAPGRALDVGCGTGRDAVWLARRGWEVTGLDAVSTALARAARRADEAGVTVRWVRGDITAPDRLGLGGGHTLLVDMGCFHGLRGAQRDRAAAAMTRAAAPGATLLLFAFAPERRGPMPSGIDQAELAARFRGWDVVFTRRATEVDLGDRIRDADPSWYRLVKR